ncbi:MAG: branched-chain amino acid aminotransferase [Burkholderiaceae bacterium]
MAIGSTIHTWFDGRWHDGNVAILGAADHATWLGTLVFDGARRFEGVVPDLDRHCERVNHSAQVMGLKATVSVPQMLELTREGLAKFSPKESVYIRPMYWSVEGSQANAVLGDPESTAFALCLESAAMPPANASATLCTTQFCRPTLASATVNAKAACLYPNNARMLREAHQKGFHNALACDQLGNVAETATANIFAVRDGEVFTPVPNGTFLNGITRQRAISLLRESGLAVHENTLQLADFHSADEVFMTGNMSKVTPVTALNETVFEAGPVSKRVRDLYWDWSLSTSL